MINPHNPEFITKAWTEKIGEGVFFLKVVFDWMGWLWVFNTGGLVVDDYWVVGLLGCFRPEI